MDDFDRFELLHELVDLLDERENVRVFDFVNAVDLFDHQFAVALHLEPFDVE